MNTLKEFLEHAARTGTALGHFNVSDSAAYRAIVESAQELNVPVMIGVSEGEREFVGVQEIAALVRVAREKRGVNVFLNADHTHSLEKVKEAAKAGFHEILFDGSKLPFEENVRETKQAVEIVRSINPEILVEGEIGYIGSSSEVLDEIPGGAALDPVSLTTREEAAQFVKETGIDVLAPAVGNMHGLLVSMVRGEVRKRLNIQRIKEIREATNIFMTLHGGSGTADEDFVSAIEAGIRIIHVNTELRVAWRHGIEEALRNDKKEVAPYKILSSSVEEMKKVVQSRLKLFQGLTK